jgi:hypothetical protein
MAELRNDESTEGEEKPEARPKRVEVGGKIETIEEINPKKALKLLRGLIKDYEDYQTVPNRRKSDFHFREYVRNYIYQINDQIKEIHAMLIEKQQMSTWAVAERLINEIASFSNDVEKGDYGFTTFFENPKLLEIDISQLYLIDNEFIVALVRMRERTEAFMDMTERNYLEDVDLWFETLDRLIGRLIRLNDDRAKLIGSYERISY